MDVTAEAAPAAGTRRTLYMDRRVCTVTPERIEVRPARSVVFLPLLTLAAGISCFAAVVTWSGSLPFWLLIALTLSAVVLVPISGIGLVYGIAGAHVVVERKKQSLVLQQGYLGMGVGTQELVPFWKIDRVVVRELSPYDERGEVQDLAQFEVAVRKLSGTEITVGTVTVLRSEATRGLARAREVAAMIGEMVGAKVSASLRRRKAAP
jgi:hypothetical protein